MSTAGERSIASHPGENDRLGLFSGTLGKLAGGIECAVISLSLHRGAIARRYEQCPLLRQAARTSVRAITSPPKHDFPSKSRIG
jgi:hypothetical protein